MTKFMLGVAFTIFMSLFIFLVCDRNLQAEGKRLMAFHVIETKRTPPARENGEYSSRLRIKACRLTGELTARDTCRRPGYSCLQQQKCVDRILSERIAPTIPSLRN